MEDIITQKQINVGFSHQVIFKTMNSYQKLMHKPQNKQLLLYDGKTIYDYNYKLEKEVAKLNFYQFTNQKQIINATYVNKYKVYMVLCEDWRLYVFKKNFELLNKFPFDSKYSVGMHYIEETDSLLLLGVDSIEMVKLGITTNIHQSKFLSTIKFEVEIISNESISQVVDWNKGYFITEKGVIDDDQLLFIWSLRDLAIYSLKTLTVKYKMHSLGKKEKSLTEVIFLRQYRYVVAGYNDGTIKVWTLSNNKKIIHSFDGHTRQIYSFALHTDKRMFWSASEDMTIRLWNLDTFTNLYTFHLQGSFHKILLINHQKFIAEQEGEICIGNISSENELICKHYGQIINYDKSYRNFKIGLVSGQFEQITFTMDNNSGMSIYSPYFENPDNFQDLSKIPISVFYPPPKSNNIKQIISCPFEENIFYMLVEGGDICRYRLEKDTGIVEDTFSTETILDSDSHPLNQKATIIQFLKVFPPQIDVEINDIRMKEGEEKEENDFDNLTDLFIQNQLIALGCSKGSVVFLNINDMKRIYARFTFHREKIISIESIFSESHNSFLMVSLCDEYRIKVVKFMQNKIQCVAGYDLKQNVSIHSCFNKLYLVNQTGEFELFHLNSESELVCNQSDEGNFHESKIISIDFLPSKKLVLTSAEDNKVKLWHMDKILLAQINIYENLCGAYFATDKGDILISHNGKLSLIREFHFGITASQIEQIEKKLSQQDKVIINMDEYYNTQKYQQYQSNLRINLNSRMKRNVSFIEDDLKKSNQIQNNNSGFLNPPQSNNTPNMLYMNLSQSQINNGYNNPGTTTNLNSTSNNPINFSQNLNQSFLNKKSSARQINSLSPNKNAEEKQKRDSQISMGSSKRMNSSQIYEVKEQVGQLQNKKQNINQLRASMQLNDSVKDASRRNNNSFDQSQRNNFNNPNQIILSKTPQNQQNMQASYSPFSRHNNQLDKQKITKPMTIVEQQYIQKMIHQQQEFSAYSKQQQKQLNQTKMTTFIDSDNSQINNYKKITALPKIDPTSHRPLTIIEKFTNEKLLSKKVLTRRDITLNKIIMRNLVRNQQAIQAVYDTQVIQGMKVNNNSNNNDSTYYSKNDKHNLSFHNKR